MLHDDHADVEDTRRTRIAIAGLGCGGAGATTVERELAKTDGVLGVYVNPATETAYLEYDATRTDAWALAQAVERAGYRPGRPVADELAGSGRSHEVPNRPAIQLPASRDTGGCAHRARDGRRERSDG